MQISVRHAPSFAVARAILAGGEVIKVEAGAMMAMSTASPSTPRWRAACSSR